MKIRDRLVGQDERSGERRSRVLHAEVLGDEGPESFLVRLVRRTTSPKPGQSKNVGQFVLRIKEGLKVCSRTSSPPISLGPQELTWLFQNAADCVVLLAGHDIRLDTLFHNGRVHEIGEGHPDGRVVRPEVTDIN